MAVAPTRGPLEAAIVMIPSSLNASSCRSRLGMFKRGAYHLFGGRDFGFEFVFCMRIVIISTSREMDERENVTSRKSDQMVRLC
jgi:hypothetical protein